MRMIPEFTPQDKAKLDRAIDRIAAGVSVYRTHGHPCKPKAKKWDMEGMVGARPPYAVHPKSPWFTDP